jgi:glycosyltransferase involved in cell wall biosynthesis
MLKIIHVTESFGGGVASAIQDFARNAPQHEHHLVYAERKKSPVDAESLSIFESAKKLPAGHLARVLWLARSFRGRRDVVVHAHSSLAGLYVRLAMNARKNDVIYSPHCYGFERSSRSRLERWAVYAVEKVLGRNTSAYACCSPREVVLSRKLRPSTPAWMIPNIAPADLQHHRQGLAEADHISTLYGAGRLSAQKDPHFFVEAVGAARASGLLLDAVWVGGGDPVEEAALRAAGIHVTGWLPRHESIRLLASADVYVHSAAWEGFPVALLEAAALGVPIVARSIPAFDGVGLPLKISRPSDLVPMLHRLQPLATREAVVAAARYALRDYNPRNQAMALKRLYSTFESVDRFGGTKKNVLVD